MLLPIEKKPPGRWTATIDHLKPGRGPRLQFAAHRGCNNLRHHERVEALLPELESINDKFANPDWFTSVFGQDWSAYV